MNNKQQLLQNPQIKLYYSPTPNGWKISILLAESNIHYELKDIDLSKGDQFSEEFQKISPNGRIPAIIHIKNNEQISVFESGAIMIYLAQNFPKEIGEKFFPKHLQKDILEWLFWLNAGLGPMAGQLSHFTYYAKKLADDKDHSYSYERYKNEYLRLISVLDRRLKDNEFVAGNQYTIADIAMWPWVKPFKRWMQSSLLQSDYIYADRWYEKVKQRPNVIKGLNVAKDLAIQAQKHRDSETKLDENIKNNLFNQKRIKNLNYNPSKL